MADFIHPNNNLFDKFHPASSPNYLSKTMNHETHYCCNKRLKEEGSKARCCECCPHETCEDSPSRFKPEHILAAIKGSNADQKALMDRASLIKVTRPQIKQILGRLKFWNEQSNRWQRATDNFCKIIAPSSHSPIINDRYVASYIDGLATIYPDLKDWLEYYLYEATGMKMDTADVEFDGKHYDFCIEKDVIEFMFNLLNKP